MEYKWKDALVGNGREVGQPANEVDEVGYIVQTGGNLLAVKFIPVKIAV